MNISLRNLFQEAELIISRYTKEEAINYRLAVHIENYLKNLKLDFNHSVDVEYNRNVINENRFFEYNFNLFFSFLNYQNFCMCHNHYYNKDQIYDKRTNY